MEFNPDKWEIMHFGKSNMDRIYLENGRRLRNVNEQRDLEVCVDSSLKWGDMLVKTAYGFIGQDMEYKSWDAMLQLYTHVLEHTGLLVVTLLE